MPHRKILSNVTGGTGAAGAANPAIIEAAESMGVEPVMVAGNYLQTHFLFSLSYSEWFQVVGAMWVTHLLWVNAVKPTIKSIIGTIKKFYPAS